ncbi:polysaccharide deacetylase family protein [Desulfosporosinus sp. OT]|uniref:polysaccharide deacetylase family protein n=1 Tax=Desulfosporosinus sp. OT TaxID=913865 RepID=UPI000223A97D|nr:polysaccharide deacetylase family protein [Desulfosporosinus sp. OT]EGW37701.1 polysaccharide deacetylase family protein [Desulfosporosinus sp. OT]
MSRMKLVSTTIFTVCFVSFSALLVGGFPYWSMATQPIILQYDSLALSKDLKTMPASPTASNQGRDTARNLAQSNDGESLTIESSSQTGKDQLLPEGTQTRLEETQTQAKESQTSERTKTQNEGAQSQSPMSQSSVASSSSPVEKSEMQTTKTQSKTGLQVPRMSVDLLPTPSPGSPGTPIHSYYDAAGNPPTAPGLAMRPRQFQPEPEKMAYLTFDDGPYPSTTPKILAILAKENVKATFFDVGRQVELNPDLLKAEYLQGNAIGNHTYSHIMDEVYKGPEAFLSDVKKAEDIIYNTLGIRPQIIRAPGGTVGHFNINYFNAVDEAGYLMEDWNIDSGDTDASLVPENLLIHNVEQQTQGKTRVVILMHDLAGKNTTIQALPTIIGMLKKQGFTFGVLGPHVRPIVFPEGLHN